MILVILVFFPHCKHSDETGGEEIVLEEKTEPANVKFVFDRKIEVPDMTYPSLYKTDNEVYVYGFSTESPQKVILNVYNNDLELASQKKFNIGEGPGDLGTGCHFFVFNENIYVPDNTQMRVNIFDKELNFVKFVLLTQPMFLPVTFVKNGEYFLGTTTELVESSKRLYPSYIVRFPGLEKKQFQTIGPSDPFNSSTPPLKLVLGKTPFFHYFYKDEKIYFIKMDDYLLSLFDMEGQLLKKVRVNVEEIKVPKDKKMPWLKEQRGGKSLEKFDLADHIQPASWLVPLGKGFAVLRRKTYSTECVGSVEADYFDYELNPKGKLEFPCFYQAFQFRGVGYFYWVYEYRQDYLYLVNENEENETFYLEKWQVTE